MLGVVALAQLMSTVDVTIVNIALLNAQQELHFSDVAVSSDHSLRESMSRSLTIRIDLMTTPPSRDPDLALQLLQHLYDVADLVFGGITELLSEYNLTETQITLLWALEPSTPSVPMRELARRLRCDPSNITLLGDQLQAAGLVERQPDPTDGRRRVVKLTTRGLELWALLLERTQQRSPLFTLSAREQAQLLRLLEKIELNSRKLPTGFLANAK